MLLGGGEGRSPNEQVWTGGGGWSPGLIYDRGGVGRWISPQVQVKGRGEVGPQVWCPEKGYPAM